MASAVLYAFVFYKSKLYADMGLQLFFFAICAYGLYEWIAKKSDNQPLNISSLSGLVNVGGIFSCLVLSVFFSLVLREYTDSDMPFWDGTTAAISIVAQFFLARKKTENWIYWIVADILYVGLYLYKGLIMTAFLYFIFIFLAYYGYLQWKKSMVKRLSDA